MKVPVFLDSETLWPSLRRLARRCRARRLVAVPYLGKGGAKLLPLGKGDILVCALTERNARSGIVSPAEIKLLQGRGVKTYLRADLHAKVYLLGGAAVVCSANLSQSSVKQLDEAGIVVRDPRTLSGIRAWFGHRTNEPITPDWLAKCAKVYRPPHGGSPTKRGRRKSIEREPSRRVWLIGVEAMEFPEFEGRDLEQGRDVARKQLASRRRYDVEEIRFTGKSRFLRDAQRGDVIVQVWEEDKERRVYPHGRLLTIKRTKTKQGGPVSYIYLEMPRQYRKIAWSKFRKVCRSFGLKLGKGVTTRQIRNPLIADDVLALVNPEKLAKR